MNKKMEIRKRIMRAMYYDEAPRGPVLLMRECHMSVNLFDVLKGLGDLVKEGIAQRHDEECDVYDVCYCGYSLTPAGRAYYESID